ncbi:MCE family protein [Mycolicibacterium thermoresistibile]|jgi:phospholipid/cholesterol/gamma-HCH transport system substrate-binding protein|uniref:Virulence factor Mce family protein n=2 Tax=Mycolicibacterium thermoresistibile TaxID=1797 RepID=G7CAX5_MYCT3|nr:MlaD family protein [Mycolicibacterium thermoresistibile]EHI14829.1 virulence factor Mce family protein [Mycolicibacterium thermoresistibile ATCC 19527]MCV7190798.1 MCE family protein [Mycolicibacterium thermoresistibile]GAT16225.1 virulence factor Mce family protein [Mycolicibacterium thermoresistibile]SNW18637.1 virulence factor Mce family protein [Mycolicibacterium thermoresistibile]
MNLSKRVRIQLGFFAVITVFAGGMMTFMYLRLPSTLFGIGQYRVTVNLPVAAGLYPNSNVTYRGTEVGRVEAVRLTTVGVDAVMSLRSDTKIPADLDAIVHSHTAAGEQFVDLVPRSGGEPHLRDGDVIPLHRASVPADINTVLRAANTGLQAIPHDNLKTVIDESFTAVGGLGAELSRIVRFSTELASDARAHLDALTAVIDHSTPVLDSQIDTSDAIQVWASNMASITAQLEAQDSSIRTLLDEGPPALDETRELFDRLLPSLPILAANLVSIADVALVYQPNLEQLLVLLPAGIEALQGAGLANRDTRQDYRGLYLSFNLNLNLPPPCTTGYLPARQMRPPSEVDYPDRPPGYLYCRIPQDSMFNVRGARNLPCAERPGKRAPTVEMCESDEEYVPLNDGLNWKGDPNATLSGQAVPQPRAGDPALSSGPDQAPPAVAAPIAIAEYDPETGAYVGPDGKHYTHFNLGRSGGSPATWQDLMLPPGN